MDVLSGIVDVLKFRAAFYFTTAFTPPFGIQVPSHANVARFHYATGGDCWVRVEGVDQPMLLTPGDLLVVPHGAAHVLSDSPNTPVTHIDQVLSETAYSGDGDLVFGGPDTTRTTRLVCGHFEFSGDFRHPLVEQLPAILFVERAKAIDFSWFDDALRLLAHEAGSDRPGAQAMVRRLAEVLFIHTVRVWHEKQGPQSGFVAAAADRNVGRSLTAFHRNPEVRWTLETLAKEGGMSRTLFVEKFGAMVGMPPMQYVTEWRMQQARRLLQDTVLPIEEIAERAAYGSVAAFSRTFKKTIGASPGAVRRAL